jgi:hypothetical protein
MVIHCIQHGHSGTWAAETQIGNTLVGTNLCDMYRNWVADSLVMWLQFSLCWVMESTIRSKSISTTKTCDLNFFSNRKQEMAIVEVSFFHAQSTIQVPLSCWLVRPLSHWESLCFGDCVIPLAGKNRCQDTHTHTQGFFKKSFVTKLKWLSFIKRCSKMW